MQGKCVSDAQIQAICLELGLALSHAQKRRVARGYALFLADNGKMLYQSRQYEFWVCSSQSNQGVYFVWITPHTVCCNCPDSQKDDIRKQKSYLCKHSIAMLLTRHAQMQGNLFP